MLSDKYTELAIDEYTHGKLTHKYFTKYPLLNYPLPDSCVVMVSTVVTLRETLAGTASLSIQNPTQEMITIRMDGM